MPELPEVETIKNTLLPILKNHKILKIDVLRDTIIENKVGDFINGLTNETFLDITRHGKYLFFHLSNDKVLISHLAMEGRYYDLSESDKNSYFARVVFHLDNNRKLIYDDSRIFGLMLLSNESNYKNEKLIQKLGPEPFDVKDVSEIINKCANTSIPIKQTITDQSILAGIGNIYADEILYKCKIHPLTETNKISENQWEDIIDKACSTLKLAISLGGSTIKSYESSKGVHGRFQINLEAYGKAGQVCPKCGSTFKFIKIGGRGTTFCPVCQKRMNNPLKVAIVGKMGSGKSTVLNLFNNYDCFTISSDEVVSFLYREPKVVEKVNILCDQNFFGEVEKDILREYLIKKPNKKRQLEELIHPLVYRYINKAFKNSGKKINIAEVPLLFESGKENDFDCIIYVDARQDLINDRLSLRNPETKDQLNKIYNSKYIDKNKEKADFIIENNGNLLTLGDRIEEVFNKLLTHLN